MSDERQHRPGLGSAPWLILLALWASFVLFPRVTVMVLAWAGLAGIVLVCGLLVAGLFISDDLLRRANGPNDE